MFAGYNEAPEDMGFGRSLSKSIRRAVTAPIQAIQPKRIVKALVAPVKKTVAFTKQSAKLSPKKLMTIGRTGGIKGVLRAVATPLVAAKKDRPIELIKRKPEGQWTSGGEFIPQEVVEELAQQEQTYDRDNKYPWHRSDAMEKAQLAYQEPTSSGGEGGGGSSYSPETGSADYNTDEAYQEEQPEGSEFYEEAPSEEVFGMQMNNQEAFQPESSAYAEENIEEGGQDESGINNTVEGYGPEAAYSEFMGLEHKELYDDGFEGLLEDATAYYKEKVRGRIGDYAKAKAQTYLDKDKAKQPEAEATGQSTIVMVGGAIALAGLAYLLLKKK